MSRLSGEGLNGDNDEAISEQVSNAWRVVGKRLLAEGYDPALVTETMLTVALKSWVGLRTRPDAVRRLRSLADQLEQDQDQPRDLPPKSGKRYSGIHGGGLHAAESFLAARFRPFLFWPRPIAFANSDRVLA